MDEARKFQLECLRSWSPERRFQAVMSLTKLVLEMREQRIKAEHPGATPQELRRLRIEETLRASPSFTQ